MTQPALSLVIPVYNRPGFIRDCLASLAPSLPGLAEIIVVDDGSTDGGATAAAIETAAAALGAGETLRIIHQTNAGPGAARNTGAAAATGDWIAFLDSDDLWMPWSGEALAAAIAAHPEAIAVFEQARPFRDLAEPADWTRTAPVHKRHASFFAMAGAKPRVIRIGTGYFAVRRSVFDAHGGFVPGLRGSEDTDFFYRMAGDGPVVALEEPAIVARRVGATDALTLNMSALAEGLYHLLDSRRAGRYGPPRPELDRSLADLLAFWVHALFWGGSGQTGYDLLLRKGAFAIMLRNGRPGAALKLLGVPVMSVLRPRAYRFRWRAEGRPT